MDRCWWLYPAILTIDSRGGDWKTITCALCSSNKVQKQFCCTENTDFDPTHKVSRTQRIISCWFSKLFCHLCSGSLCGTFVGK